MGCPGCIATGWVGGWIGGYLGIQAPERPGARALSALLTANLICITVIALKVFFDVSLCGGGGITLGNVVQVGVKTLVMGVIYSIGVNYILNRYVFPPSQVEETCDESSCESGAKEEETPSCCCKGKV